MYIPPVVRAVFLYFKFFNILVIIAGNFNFPDINWFTLMGTSASNEFCSIIFKLNLIVDKATHIQDNILD